MTKWLNDGSLISQNLSIIFYSEGFPLAFLHSRLLKYVCLISFSLLLNGCANVTTQQTQVLYPQEVSKRNQQMLALQDWKISGKIAFLQGKQRDSANINWHYIGSNNSQRLDLTTYLGINVLHLNSSDDLHTIKVDGKRYQGENLDELISALTGYILPTQALSFWLKGLPYSDNDQLQYNEQTKLPNQLESHYNNQQWQIMYASYQNIRGYQLPKKLTIKQDNLTIKIVINQWHLND